HHPSVLPDVSADGLRDRQGARLQGQPDRVPARPAVGYHHHLRNLAAHLAAAGPARHRPDHGVLQYAAGGCAAVQVARRPVHHKQYLPPPGEGRPGAAPRPASLRRSGVLHRRLRRRQRRDPAGLADLQPEPGGRGLQQRQLQSLHVARPVVQLLRRERARRQADPRLSGEAPYELSPNCQAGAFYNAVNVNPAWTPGGTPQGGTIVPQQTIRSIGDVLSAKNIPWKYYGGGYNLSVAGNPINGYCNICNPFEYQANY